jgi:hypothetical protein
VFKLEQTWNGYRNLVIKHLGKCAIRRWGGDYRVTFKVYIRVPCYEGGPGPGLGPLMV